MDELLNSLEARLKKLAEKHSSLVQQKNVLSEKNNEAIIRIEKMIFSLKSLENHT